MATQAQQNREFNLGDAAKNKLYSLPAQLQRPTVLLKVGILIALAFFAASVDRTADGDKTTATNIRKSYYKACGDGWHASGGDAVDTTTATGNEYDPDGLFGIRTMGIIAAVAMAIHLGVEVSYVAKTPGTPSGGVGNEGNDRALKFVYTMAYWTVVIFSLVNVHTLQLCGPDAEDDQPAQVAAYVALLLVMLELATKDEKAGVHNQYSLTTALEGIRGKLTEKEVTVRLLAWVLQVAFVIMLATTPAVQCGGGDANNPAYNTHCNTLEANTDADKCKLLTQNGVTDSTPVCKFYEMEVIEKRADADSTTAKLLLKHDVSRGSVASEFLCDTHFKDSAGPALVGHSGRLETLTDATGPLTLGIVLIGIEFVGLLFVLNHPDRSRNPMLDYVSAGLALTIAHTGVVCGQLMDNLPVLAGVGITILLMGARYYIGETAKVTVKSQYRRAPLHARVNRAIDLSSHP